MKNKKVKRVMIPYLGEEIPKKADKKAFERLKKGGKLFLLQILDKKHTKRLKHKTGHIGNNSQMIKNVEKNIEKIHKKSAEDFIDDVKKKASKKEIFVKSSSVTGEPEEEVLKAIRKNSIQLVLVEKLKSRIIEIFEGNEINYIQQEAKCEVETVNG